MANAHTHQVHIIQRIQSTCSKRKWKTKSSGKVNNVRTWLRTVGAVWYDLVSQCGIILQMHDACTHFHPQRYHMHEWIFAMWQCRILGLIAMACWHGVVWCTHWYIMYKRIYAWRCAAMCVCICVYKWVCVCTYIVCEYDARIQARACFYMCALEFACFCVDAHTCVCVFCDLAR